MTNMMLRSERVKARRRQLNITQKELADTLGIKQAQVSRYESYESEPQLERLYDLAKALKTTPDYLLGKTDEPEIKMPSNLAILDRRSQRYYIQVVGKISAAGGGTAALAFEDKQGMIDTEFNVQFALIVCGDSMEPTLYNGDIVLVQETPYNELRDGDMVVVIVNGEEGIVKRIYLEPESGFVLKSDNPQYKPKYMPFERLNVDCLIVGRVVESRRRYHDKRNNGIHS